MSGQWHKTAWAVKIVGIDARPFVLILLLPLYLRVWTILLVIVVIGIFGILATKKLTLPVIYRRLRGWLSGSARAARPWWYWVRWKSRWWLRS